MSVKALVDTGLQREAETLFANSDDILIAAFHVLKLKQQEDSAGAQLLKALGAKTFLAKEAPQPRLLCLAVRRAKHGRGFKPSLHVLRPPGHDDGDSVHARRSAGASSSGASVAAGAKSYPLKSILGISVPASKYEAHPSHVLEIQFSGAPGTAPLSRIGSTGGANRAADASPSATFKMGSREELLLVTALLLALISQGGYKQPHLSGLDAGEVHAWWLGQQGAVLAALGPFAAAVLLPGGGEDDADGGPGGPRVLLSGKEESALEELLGLFDLGVGDGEEFRARLQEEHEALEAANVQALMSSVPAAEAVVAAIRGTQGMLEDLDETLAVFDTKLRHMRADIAAIEASNNALERHARNNGSLRATLQDLLSSLRLPADTEALLEAPPWGKDSRLPLVVSAAWQLHASLSRLDPDPHPQQEQGGQGGGGGAAPAARLSPYLLQMRVVQEARESLEDVRGRFVISALTALRGLVRGEAEVVLAALAANTDRAARLLPPPHDRLRSACGRQRELVRALGALQPAALPKLCGEVVAAVNVLLRKELRVSVSELRKAAQLDMHANPIDYSLTGSSAARAAAGAAGSVVGGKGPPGSVLGASVLGSSEDPGERDEAASSAAASDLGLASGLGLGLGLGAGPGSVASKYSRSTFRSAWSRGGLPSSDSSSLAIPLHEAWGLLLESYLPHLLTEAETAADWLGLWERSGRPDAGPGAATGPATAREGGGRQRRRRRKGGAEAGGDEVAGGGGSTAAAEAALDRAGGRLTRQGRQFMEALFAGVDAEFMALVDLTSKHAQALSLPMMALASSCCAALLTRGSLGAPLAALMAAAHARLKDHFGRFVEAQKAAVEALGARLAAAGSVKSHHVLPFVAQFALMAHHMEVMLSQRPEGLLDQLSGGAAAGGAGAAGAGGGGAGGGWGGAAAAAALGGTGGGGGGDDDEQDDEAVNRRVTAQAAASWQVRAEVDAVYGELLSRLFAALERTAACDAKHGDRLRAENYAYFVEAVRPLVRHVAALEPYMLQAETKLDESLRRYVSAQLGYTPLGRLLEAGQAMEGMLGELGLQPGELPYQAGFSAADMRALLATSTKDIDKKVARMYGRVRKHLGNSSLAFRVWERIEEQIMDRYRRLADHLAACYPTLELLPSPEDLEEVFRGLGPAAGTP